MTPEGRVKKQIDAVLEEFGCYVEKPVPSGFGKSGLDYSTSFRGLALYIETKAPGKDPTPRQKARAAEMLLSGAAVFIISGEEGIASLICWLLKRQKLIPDPRSRGWWSGLLELVPLKNSSSSRTRRSSKCSQTKP